MRIWSFPSFYPNHLPNRKWNGIFAHRQNIGLMRNGVDVKVIHPVVYRWPTLLQSFFPCTTDLNSANLPRQREMDGLQVYHPVIADPRPSRLFHTDFGTLYKSAVRDFFVKQRIKLSADDFFYAQWVPEAGMVVELGKELGVKTGVLVIGDDVLVLPQYSEVAKAFFCKTMLAADYRFSVSQHLAAEAKILVGTNLPFTVVRRGVDYDVFHPVEVSEKLLLRQQYKIPEDALVCLCVGTLLTEKGWMDVLDALQMLAPAHPHLLLAAVHAGSSNFNWQEAVATRGLQHRIIDFGEVAPENMPAVYQLADMFCLASHSEGISNAVTEAMSSALPVVTSNLPGHLELIEHQQTGWLFEPKDVMGLTNALDTLLNEPLLRVGLGANARQFIEQQWGSFADNSKKIITTFQASNAMQINQ